MHVSSKLALLTALCALGTAAAVAPALSPVPAGEDPAILEEERLYWNNGRLIRWQNGKTRQRLTTSAARQRSEEVRATARQLAACAANMADSTCEA